MFTILLEEIIALLNIESFFFFSRLQPIIRIYYHVLLVYVA